MKCSVFWGEVRAVPEINLWGGVDDKNFFLVGGGTFHN